MSPETIIGLIITIIMGLGWGSFSTMATYRIPRGMPWIGDEPRCFMCKHPLNILDYFSIISYFIHRGKCRHCKGEYEENISYFLTELGITVLFVMCYLKYGFGDLFVLLTGMVVAFVILVTVDAEHKRIPSKILISVLLIGLVYRVFVDQTFYGALYGGIGGGVLGLAIRSIYFTLKGQKDIAMDYAKWQHEDRFIGPGFDYVKLLAIVGVWLSAVHLAVFMLVAGSTIIAWRLLHPKSLRIGTIMGCWLMLFVIYPEYVDRLAGFLF